MPGARNRSGTGARTSPGFQGPEKPRGSAFGRLYRGETQFDFINRWKYWFAFSGAVIAIGLAALAVGGLNFSIDFKGGNQWQVPTTASVATVKSDLCSMNSVLCKATVTQLRNTATRKQEISVEEPSSVTSDSHLVNDVTVKLASIAGVTVDKVNYTGVGPSWGSLITKKAVEAVVVFLVLITLAISIYFEAKMAVGALVALIHDMLVTIGIYALSGFQVSPDTVIAFLTVLGYSLYDTIVVFDKVKENTKGLASTNRVTYTDVVNLSMNEVLARSINTSFVAVMPVFCILVIGSWVLGASALNDFGLALFIGLMSGAYSSIFIASPILALLKEREPRYVEIRRRLAAYPKARRVLTPASVASGAWGSLVAGAPIGPTGAGQVGTGQVGTGERATGVPGEGAKLPEPAEVPAGVGAADVDGAGGNGSVRNGTGGRAASSAGDGAGGSAGAPKGTPGRPGSAAGGGRSLPPRPRPKKKVPRRR